MEYTRPGRRLNWHLVDKLHAARLREEAEAAERLKEGPEAAAQRREAERREAEAKRRAEAAEQAKRSEADEERRRAAEVRWREAANRKLAERGLPKLGEGELRAEVRQLARMTGCPEPEILETDVITLWRRFIAWSDAERYRVALQAERLRPHVPEPAEVGTRSVPPADVLPPPAKAIIQALKKKSPMDKAAIAVVTKYKAETLARHTKPLQMQGLISRERDMYSITEQGQSHPL